MEVILSTIIVIIAVQVFLLAHSFDIIFLDTENMVNLFAETGYDYYTITGKGLGRSQHQSTFLFSGGPVIYFNTSVGLEFIITYATTKIAGSSGNNNKIQFGIGFQIHLEKDK